MTKKHLTLIWTVSVLILLAFYVMRPEYFTPEYLKFFIERFGFLALPAYIVIFVLRGLTLIPSLPFIVLGTLLFPESRLLVLGISMFCITLSAVNIYYFSDYLGFSKIFEKKYNLQKYKNLIEKYGFWIILAWSFFPLVPTDAICYVSGAVKFNFKKYILAVFMGELLMVSLLIYFRTLF